MRSTQTPSVFHRLPQELLEDILDAAQALNSPVYASRTPAAFVQLNSSCKRFLASTALVCKSLAAPCQERLYRHIDLSNLRQPRSLAENESLRSLVKLVSVTCKVEGRKGKDGKELNNRTEGQDQLGRTMDLVRQLHAYPNLQSACVQGWGVDIGHFGLEHLSDFLAQTSEITPTAFAQVIQLYVIIYTPFDMGVARTPAAHPYQLFPMLCLPLLHVFPCAEKLVLQCT